MATQLNISQYIGVAPKSEFELAELVEKGLPVNSLSRLREKGLSFSELSSLVISPRTLQHRKARGKKLLTHEETDRVVRVARMLALAEQVFGNQEKALAWLRTPDDRLNNRTALSMLDTEIGGRIVEKLLWQIDEGVFS
jgi:putative toxin-antitoxin system antitoxin component (TIGR02293 family)